MKSIGRFNSTICSVNVLCCIVFIVAPLRARAVEVFPTQDCVPCPGFAPIWHSVPDNKNNQRGIGRTFKPIDRNIEAVLYKNNVETAHTPSLHFLISFLPTYSTVLCNFVPKSVKIKTNRFQINYGKENGVK